MKHLLKLLCLFAIVFAIQSCSSSTTTDQQQGQEESQEQVLGAEQAEAAVCESRISSPSVGQGYIDAAKATIDAANANMPEGYYTIPYGAKLPACELQTMLDDLGKDPEVWAMLGYKEDGSLEIIFQGKPSGGTEYSYYDFTAPCPTVCPE